MIFPHDVLPEAASKADIPLLTQCTAREGGGHLCEVMLTHPTQEHAHWISSETIRNNL